VSLEYLKVLLNILGFDNVKAGSVVSRRRVLHSKA